MRLNEDPVLPYLKEVKLTSELPIELKHLLLENGKLDDMNTKSEYERKVDCWNKFSVRYQVVQLNEIFVKYIWGD